MALLSLLFMLSIFRMIYFGNYYFRVIIQEFIRVKRQTQTLLNILKEMSQDPQQARYLRKQYAQKNQDEDEFEQDQDFHKDIQSAVNAHSKKVTVKSIEDQVEYFGNAIEPFNMRNQEEMGEVDGDGFFVFKRKNQFKDAWLESIDQGDDEVVADQVKKKIKLDGNRFKTIYEGDDNINEDYKEYDEEEEGEEGDSENGEGQEDENKMKVKEDESDGGQQLRFQPNEIKQLIVELLPQNRSANVYLKELKKSIKKDDNRQMHDKILELSNMYIDQTGDYDILTKKKEQLELDIDEGDEPPELNWDDDESGEDLGKQKGPKGGKSNMERKFGGEGRDEDDNIFDLNP